MSLYTLNRQSRNKRGTGLPVYFAKEHQDRFKEIPIQSNLGYWQVPTNKLPTLQYTVPSLLTVSEIQLIKTGSSQDTVFNTIDVSNVEYVCFRDNEAEENIRFIIIDDRTRDFTIPCGTYYLQFTMSDASVFYTELFTVGIFGISIDLQLGDIINTTPTEITTNLDLTISGTFTSFNATANGNNYNSTPFPVTLPIVAMTVTSEDVDVVVNAVGGPYTAKYRVFYDADPGNPAPLFIELRDF